MVGLSILSGAHMELFPLIVDGLRKKGLGDRLVVAGGIIPEEDITSLKKLGVKGIFGPGTSTKDIINYINTEVGRKS
ncbi:MAG: Methylmalonyl-CoA mutase domain protein [Dehalococcoidia bacterium]|nr:Methylmalonyl-CoA mutase domain protein [Dehalococcoidia bacterium]